MEKEKILETLTKIFRNILDDDSIQLVTETTANDIEGWDSLTHIQLVVAIERHFKIRFTSKEIQSWGNIGNLLDCVHTKIS